MTATQYYHHFYEPAFFSELSDTRFRELQQDLKCICGCDPYKEFISLCVAELGRELTAKEICEFTLWWELPNNPMAIYWKTYDDLHEHEIAAIKEMYNTTRNK